MNQDVFMAIDVLKNGGIVIFPTDTAFGIGCRIDDKQAVARLFSLRKRDIHKATPVLVSGVAMAQEWVDEVPENAHKLMEKHWPGGLTIVLKSTDTRVVSTVKGGGNTLGLRMPDLTELRAIISHVCVPIIGTSANFAGEETPFSQEELNPELVKLVDFVLPGSTKGQRVSSTVVDCTVEPFKILRQGAVEL